MCDHSRATGQGADMAGRRPGSPVHTPLLSRWAECCPAPILLAAPEYNCTGTRQTRRHSSGRQRQRRFMSPRACTACHPTDPTTGIQHQQLWQCSGGQLGTLELACAAAYLCATKLANASCRRLAFAPSVLAITNSGTCSAGTAWPAGMCASAGQSATCQTRIPSQMFCKVGCCQARCHVAANRPCPAAQHMQVCRGAGGY